MERIELSELLSFPPIQERVCANLSFDEAIALQEYLGPIILNCSFFVAYGPFFHVTLPGVNEVTIRAHHLFKIYQNHITAFRVAIAQGDFLVADFLFDKISEKYTNNPNNVIYIKSLMLLKAVERGDESGVKYMLGKGADPNVETRIGLPLVEAAKRPSIIILKLLLDSGAQINQADKNRKTALIAATQTQNRPAISLLMERGAHTPE